MEKCLTFKKNSDKVVPKCIINLRKECCICKTNQFRFHQCSICSSGIVCYNCYKKLTNEQIKKCPVCRSNTENVVIEVNIDTTTSIKDCTRYRKLLSCNNIFIFISFIVVSYFLGLFVVTDIWYLNPSELGYFLTFIIGAIVFSLMLSCCWMLSNGCLVID